MIDTKIFVKFDFSKFSSMEEPMGPYIMALYDGVAKGLVPVILHILESKEEEVNLGENVINTEVNY